MSIPGVSTILGNVAIEILHKAQGFTFTLEFEFNQATSGLKVKPVSIEGLSITQMFCEQVEDQIGCKCTFFPLDLYNILNNTQDLKLTIIQRRWERKFYLADPREEPDIYTFKVLIENPQDLMKQIPPAAIKQTAETAHDREQLKTPLPLEMQLVADVDYELIKQKLNANLADVDVQGVILHACNIWGIKNTYISPPDNTKTYQNFIIPPMISFPEFIPWLQKEKGIYKNGVASYFCNNTWYIYPPFDTEPERNEVINIVKLPENSVDGGDSYMAVIDDDSLSVVTFSPVAAQAMAQSSTENKGNAVTVRQADSSMDVARDIDNDGKITLNKEAAVIAKVNNSATNSANQVNTVYGGTTSNLFAQLSDIAAGQMEVVSLAWIHAKPWMIIPGMKCILHYDDTTKGTAEEDYYSSAAGVVAGIHYDLVIQGQPAERIYRWDAKIGIAVKPLETNSEQQTEPAQYAK